jgi:type IV secretion system protein VirB1
VFVAALSLTLVHLFSTCAPNVGSRTLAAIASYESDTQPWSIGDNTAHRGHVYASRDDAERAARALVAAGHNLDLGLMQVNTVHLGENGLSLNNAFDPCTNISAGAAVLSGAYRRAASAFGPGQVALQHALSAYNTGSLFAGASYARGVTSRARRLHLLAQTPATFAGAEAIVVHAFAPVPASMPHPPIGDGERDGATP